MDDIPTGESTIDPANCSPCTLRRRPSMMKRLRKSFRKAVSNKEVAESKMVPGVLRPSYSAEMLHSPEAFTEESCSRRSSNETIFGATVLWDNLVSYLETNVNPGTRRRSLRMYNNCFFGHEAVNCLHKYITNNLSRQCDRDQVAILCHRFLVLGIIEDAKCAPEDDKDFSTGLLYRLTSEKKFWELACLKSEESDDNCKDSSVTLTCLSDDCKVNPAEEETSDKCRKRIRQRSLRRSLLKSVKSHPKEKSPELELSLTTEESSDHELHPTVIITSPDIEKTEQYTISSIDTKSNSSSTNNYADSSCSSSSKGTEYKSGTLPLTVQHKAKKPAQTRKRRWNSVKERSRKAGNKQPHLIPQLKAKISLRRKKRNVPGSETNKHWITFGYI